MKPSFWQRMDQLARNLTPFGLTLILVLAGVVPLQIEGMARITPLLALASVYHWAVYRPDLLPPGAVFALALVQDILGGLPLGMSCLVYLTVQGIVVWQNRFLAGKSFLIVWMGFSLILGAAALQLWALMSAFHGAVLDLHALTYQYMVTIGFFPLLSWSLIRWQQTVLRQE
ncbi:hypothetical protein [Magnetospira sp. QH-2]|uniref:hypothetical protein n=1 Tax=Magnetospira sp. (strain QH-2) TaxID=1288970 RepID=UPI0003E81A80|nr:hypothetical protein [Magnetospira sp. QH-2]CCQ72942.1 putative cell shape-determining protein MreD [Magnetospira sp. QH-2]